MLEYANDLEEAITILVEGGQWEEALRLVRSWAFKICNEQLQSVTYRMDSDEIKLKWLKWQILIFNGLFPNQFP